MINTIHQKQYSLSSRTRKTLVMLLVSILLLLLYGCQNTQEATTTEIPDPVLEFVGVKFKSTGEKKEYEVTLANKTEYEVVDLVVEINFFFGHNKGHKKIMTGSSEIPPGKHSKYKIAVNSGREVSYSVYYRGKMQKSQKSLIPFAGEKTFSNESDDMLQKVHSLLIKN